METPHPFPNFWSIFVTFFSNPFPTISSADANCEKPLFLVFQAYIKFFLTNPFDMITNAISIKQYVFHQYLSHYLQDSLPPPKKKNEKTYWEEVSEANISPINQNSEKSSFTNIPPQQHLSLPIVLLCSLCQNDILTTSRTQKQPTFTKI